MLLQEDNIPQLQWWRGVVQELFPGRDGQARCAHLCTAQGKVLRPVQCLHLKECSSCEERSEVTAEEPIDPESESQECHWSRHGHVIKENHILLTSSQNAFPIFLSQVDPEAIKF